MNTVIRLFAGMSLAAALTLVPVDVGTANGPTGDRSPLVLAGACAQATECAVATHYLCSTYNGNEKGYRCTKGCEAQVE